MLKSNLKELLKKKNLTLKELNKISNVELNTLEKYYYNTFKIMRIETVEKLCKALDCEYDDLLV